MFLFLYHVSFITEAYLCKVHLCLKGTIITILYFLVLKAPGGVVEHFRAKTLQPVGYMVQILQGITLIIGFVSWL